MTSFAEVVAGDKREDCFAYVDIDKAGNYSCEDVYGTLLLWQEFESLLRENGLMELFREVEMPIVTILARMELAGICLDPTVLAALSVEFTGKLEILEQQIYALVGHDFQYQLAAAACPDTI